MHAPTDLLTTEQLLDVCARQGVSVSTPQLGRWVRAGLIPASLRRRHGRGRGQGAEWLWEMGSLDRIMLIAQTLHTGDPSFMRAARALAAAGYPPEAHYMRQLLLDRLVAFEQLLAKRQTYLTDGRAAADKRRRLRRNMRRWTPDMPEEVFQRFYLFNSALFGVVSLEALEAQPFFHHMQEIISIPVMRQRLSTVENAWLLAKYEEASQALPAMAAVGLAMLNLFLPALATWSERHQKPAPSVPLRVDAEQLLAGVRQEGGQVVVAPEHPLGELRLLITLFLAVFPSEEDALLPQWMSVLGELFAGLTRYLNIPAKHMALLGLPEVAGEEGKG